MTALGDNEDNGALEPPAEGIEHFRERETMPPPSVRDTERPPPLDFSRMAADEKLTWLCNTVQHLADAQLAFRQDLTVLNARVGVVDGHDGGPSLFKKVSDLTERFETIVGGMSLDVEAMRNHLLGKGASIHEFARAEERRHTAAPTDRPGGR